MIYLMKLGRKDSTEGVSKPAAARYDSESDAASRNGLRFHLAGFWQVPVGYEDETGFHCGEPQVIASQAVFEQQANVTSTQQF